MKKTLTILLLLALVLSLGACGKEEKQAAEQIPAIVVDTDPETRTLICDPAQAGEFRNGLTVDCREAPVYRQNNPEELSFLDLAPGDRIVISFSEAARKDIQAGKDRVEASRVDAAQ